MNASSIDADDPSLAALELALAKGPERLDVRRRYGLLLYRRRRFKDAATQFSLCARQAPDDNESFLLLSRALYRLRLFDYARVAAEMASRSKELLPAASKTLEWISEEEARAFTAPDSPEEEAAEQDAPEAANAIELGADAYVSDVVPEVAAPPPQDRSVGKPRRGPLAAKVCFGLDKVIEFLAIEKALILRNITYSSRFKMAKLVEVGGIMGFLVVFHAILFSALGRGFAGQISVLTATLAAFTNWTCFSRVRIRVTPFGLAAGYNKTARIRWIHLFLAEAVWDMIRVGLGVTAVVFVGRFYLPVYSSPNVAPNIPLLTATLTTSALVGTGLGITMHSLEARWPMMVALDHVLVWLMYFSCGVYGSYVQQPEIMAPWVSINPLLSVTEYTRKAFDGSYPVANLNMIYPLEFAGVLIAVGLALRKAEHH